MMPLSWLAARLHTTLPSFSPLSLDHFAPIHTTGLAGTGEDSDTSDAGLEAMFNEMDQDGSGKVNEDELTSM